nr:EcsC family protein [Clostridium formicaceticum]
MPDKLKLTLENAFSKGFQLVFEKGEVYIEKTYKKDRIKLEYDLNNCAIDKDLSKKYIKRLDKQANYAKMLNTSFTVLEGGVLGFLGIGLPDIPLFIAVIMRTIYEVALSYSMIIKVMKKRNTFSL